LEKVALLRAFRHETMRLRNPRPLESRQWRLECGRAHIRPDNIAQLHTRIRLQPDPFAKSVLLRLGRNIDALAGDVVLPAVIGAEEAPLLLATEPHGAAQMGGTL